MLTALHESSEPTRRPPLSDGGTDEAIASSATVLLAEDDDAMRETMQRWLTNETQWDVMEASDGTETLNRLDDTVDALVLDRRMPGHSGPEIVDRLDETDFDGTVVVVSAYRADSHLGEDDVANYLTKPIDRETFLAQLRQTIG